MTSLDDLARHVGVSTATVSRALSGRGRVSDATRERVRAAAAELGYVPSATASGLASGRTQSIGVLVPLVDRWFFAAVLGGISAHLAAHGHDVTLYNVTDDAAQRAHLFRTSLRRGRVDALIALSVDVSDDEAQSLHELGMPVLALGAPGTALPSLRVDDAAVARTATAHLLRLGHRRIAHIGLDRADAPAFDIPSVRARGFVAALADAGLRPAGFEAGEFTIEAGHRAARRLLSNETPPTAIFAASDEMAFGALFAARELGIDVPGALSVIGVDGHEMGAFFDLTTIEQFPHAQGERAAAAVLSLVDAEKPRLQGPLPFRLLERGSTGPA